MEHLEVIVTELVETLIWIHVYRGQPHQTLASQCEENYVKKIKVIPKKVYVMRF